MVMEAVEETEVGKSTVALCEEQSLWEAFAATGSVEAREKLVLQSLPLVYYCLGRIGITRSYGSDYEDLVHQGLLGLINAVDRYNPGMGTRFSTYATIRIRGQVLDYLRSDDWMGRSARRRARIVQHGVTQFWCDHHREPTTAELAASLNLDVETVEQGLLDASRQLVSLDAEQPNGEEDETTVYDMQKDENQPDPAELTCESDQKAQLAAAIRRLPEREQLVLSLYYFEELTLKEIGKVLQVSESRVCQLHSRAILNIRAMMQDEQHS